jgi:hypothetical protein
VKSFFVTRRKWALTGVAALFALVVLAIGSLFAALWIESGLPTELPAPTGAFAVGRAIYDWRDNTTVDTLAPNPGTKREILAWIWYPAVAGASATTDDYTPPSMLAAAGPAGLLHAGVDQRRLNAEKAQDAPSPKLRAARPAGTLRTPIDAWTSRSPPRCARRP